MTTNEYVIFRASEFEYRQVFLGLSLTDYNSKEKIVTEFADLRFCHLQIFVQDFPNTFI